MTTPSQQKRALVFVVALIPPSSRKTSATVEGGSKKGRFYRPLPTRFRRNGFEYRQIAREVHAAVYEQTWKGSENPSIAYEVICIRRREGFQIDGRFVEPAEVYPASELWGANGFTYTDCNKALDKFFEISLEDTSTDRKGGELKMGESYRRFVGNAKYLKKEDIPSPVNTSILWIKKEEVTAPGKGTVKRLVLYFDGLKKGLVLNRTNAEALLEITGTDDPETWADTPVQLFVDPDVTYGGKKIGGIRIRKPLSRPTLRVKPSTDPIS